MNRKELQELIDSWENLNLIVKHIGDHPEDFKVLVNLAFDDLKEENWRAIWLMDKIHEQHPALVIPYLTEMTEFALRTRNDSKRRHLLKIISLNEIPEPYLATMLNYCVDIFTNASIPVAVRVHAMQVLFNISQREPDFKGELIGLIEQEIEYHGSAGIKSRGRKLLTKLYT